MYANHEEVISNLRNSGFTTVAFIHGIGHQLSRSEQCADDWKFEWANTTRATDAEGTRQFALSHPFWCYAYIARKGCYSRIVKVGKSEAKDGMVSRFSSYQSGHPSYNDRNGPQNRRVYKAVRRLLKQGWSFEIVGFKVPHVEVDVSVPWGGEPAKIKCAPTDAYENSLIKLIDPLWNRYAN